MIYLDTLILDAIETACRRFQRLTGRTNIWLAVYLTLDLRILLLTLPLRILTTGVLYLLACDPLPPRAATVREQHPGLAQVPVEVGEAP